MTLDDRLHTVLDVAADSDTVARAQYRQLVDLLGSGRTVADGSLTAAAFLRLAALARRIPAAERAAILADPALRLRSPPLVAQLCEGDLQVALAAIDAADLDDAGWTLLSGVLGEELEGRIRSARMAGRARNGEGRPPLLMQRQSKRTSLADDLTPSADVPERVAGEAPHKPVRTEPASPQARREPVGDISEIVARIERFRLRRRERATEEVIAAGRGDDALELSDAEEVADSGAPPVAAAREVDCTISPEGRVTWSRHLAPMLTGLTLSPGNEAPARIDEATATALRRQQAVRGGKLTIAASPVVTGEWRLDAAPDFDAVGRFMGHHARLTRQVGAGDRRGDLVRQALHELRTPLGALQGFSEIIQQQLFGPVPHRYRALAASIAGETASLLAGMDEIERLVRLRLGTRKLSDGETEAGPLLAGLVEQVEPLLTARGAALTHAWQAPQVSVPVERGDLERSLWRVLAAIVDAAQAGDRIALDASVAGDTLRLEFGLPETLAAMDDAALFGASLPEGENEAETLAVGMLGRGFALRLAAAEARAAGGSLQRDGKRIAVTLPCHDTAREDHAEAAA